MEQRQIFLLSPASCGGKRAALLFNDRAEFDIARRVREGTGAPLGEVFSFLSGLYFRGKITYARAFQNAPPPARAGDSDHYSNGRTLLARHSRHAQGSRAVCDGANRC